MGSYTYDPSFEFPESKSGDTSNNSSVKAKDFSTIVCGEQIMKLASSNPKKPAGRKKFKETRHPVYRGIRSRNSGKWVCEVRKPKNSSRLWLGTHPTAEMAARAHDVAAIALRGPAACINFADSTWRLPIPASSADKDIQKAATEAAEAFRPHKTIENPDEVKVRLIVMYMEEEDDEFPAGYMSYMAEGMMMRPLPRYLEGNSDHVEPPTADVSLWSYPF